MGISKGFSLIYINQADKIATLVKSANVSIESYWPSLFAKLVEKRNIEDLIMNVGVGSCAAPMAVAASGGGATPAAAAPVAEEKKVNKNKKMNACVLVVDVFGCTHRILVMLVFDFSCVCLNNAGRSQGRE